MSCSAAMRSRTSGVTGPSTPARASCSKKAEHGGRREEVELRAGDLGRHGERVRHAPGHVHERAGWARLPPARKVHEVLALQHVERLGGVAVPVQWGPEARGLAPGQQERVGARRLFGPGQHDGLERPEVQLVSGPGCDHEGLVHRGSFPRRFRRRNGVGRRPWSQTRRLVQSRLRTAPSRASRTPARTNQ
jgi:hypothetical protein